MDLRYLNGSIISLKLKISPGNDLDNSNKKREIKED